MSGIGVELPQYLKSGELARLIPVVADKKKEERVTSAVLAALMAVPPLANSLFEAVGAPVRKRAQIICFTEIVFNDEENEKQPRPDGLIIIRTGKKQWSALVEAKVANSNLQQDQIEEYLRLAKIHKIDALITFSNQFAALPTHHPLDIPANKLRSVDLYHFSWMALLSKAQLLSEGGELTDPEQAFIVRELIRYLQHESSGVVAFNSMGKQWRDICQRIQQGAAIKKSEKEISETVGDWHELVRYATLELTSAVGRPVEVVLHKGYAKDPAKRLDDDIDNLANGHFLTAFFKVPDAASRIEFTADFPRRTLNISMKLDAPKDKSRATASINYLAKQLKDKPNIDDIIVRADWPGRAINTDAGLQQVINDSKVLLTGDPSTLPKSIEFIRVCDLAGKFQGRRTFVEISVAALKDFYADVGQNLKAWVPSAPKIREDSHEEEVQIESDTAERSETDNFADKSVDNTVKKGKGDDRLLNIPTFLIRKFAK